MSVDITIFRPSEAVRVYLPAKPTVAKTPVSAVLALIADAILLAEPTNAPSASTAPEITTPFNKNLKSAAVASAPTASKVTVLAFAAAMTPVLLAIALMALAFEIALPSLRAIETPSEAELPTLLPLMVMAPSKIFLPSSIAMPCWAAVVAAPRRAVRASPIESAMRSLESLPAPTCKGWSLYEPSSSLMPLKLVLLAMRSISEIN